MHISFTQTSGLLLFASTVHALVARSPELRARDDTTPEISDNGWNKPDHECVSCLGSLHRHSLISIVLQIGPFPRKGMWKCRYPMHSKPHCTPGKPCAFKCKEGYKEYPEKCPSRCIPSNSSYDITKGPKRSLTRRAEEPGVPSEDDKHEVS